MIQTAEEAIEVLRQLSPTDRQKVYDWFFPWLEEERRKESAEEENNNQQPTDTN